MEKEVKPRKKIFITNVQSRSFSDICHRYSNAFEYYVKLILTFCSPKMLYHKHYSQKICQTY